MIKPIARLGINNCITGHSFVRVSKFLHVMHSCVCTQHTLHTINYCLSIFKIFNLSYRYVSFYVNIIKSSLDTHCLSCLIMTKVTMSGEY